MELPNKYYDQHVHCIYSEDSNEKIEEYIKRIKELDINYLAFTDHLDYEIPWAHKDWIADFKSRHNEIEKLRNTYKNITFIEGIEIGYNKKHLEEIIAIRNENSFDLVNLSVHSIGKIDFYMKEFFIEYGIDEINKMYFNLLNEAMDEIPDFDVLSHFDYGFKTSKSANRDIKISKYENEIIDIMKKVIRLDKTLEINLKVQTAINDLEHTRYIIHLYKSLGGKYITLSSDAHSSDKLYKDFDIYFKILKEEGFDSLSYFINRKRYLIKI